MQQMLIHGLSRWVILLGVPDGALMGCLCLGGQL